MESCLWASRPGADVVFVDLSIALLGSQAVEMNVGVVGKRASDDEVLWIEADRPPI